MIIDNLFNKQPLDESLDEEVQGLTNPKTGKEYTRQELRDLSYQQIQAADQEPDVPNKLPQATTNPMGSPSKISYSGIPGMQPAKPVAGFSRLGYSDYNYAKAPVATKKLPQATTNKIGSPSKISYSGIPGMKAKPVADFSRLGYSDYNYAKAPAKAPSKTVAVTAPTVPKAPAAPKAPKVPGAPKAPRAPSVNKVSPVPAPGAPTAAERAKLDQLIAAALKQPVAEMLAMAEVKEDIDRIKKFIDKTFIKYQAIDETAISTRNQLIEHVAKHGSMLARKNSQD